MMVFGFYIFSIHSDSAGTYHFNNYLHYKDALCMTFFLWLGNFLRRNNLLIKMKEKKYILIIFALYTLGHLLRFIFRMKGIDELLIAPVVISHGGNALNPLQIPAYLYYVVLGSLLCFGIMQYIEKNRILEYFGRNSLVVYCVHFIFLELYVGIINSIVPPVGMLNAILFITIVFILSLLSCSVVIFIMRYKPLNYLIGKF